MRALVLVTLAALSGCTWFTAKKAPTPDPTQIIVTGAPLNSSVYVDGSQVAQSAAPSDHPQVLDVAAGEHKVEIRVGDSIVYREQVYVAPGEHRVVRVLSGLN
jgi:cytoskeletal protein RodZ